MKGFWKWLMHANARAILTVAILVLLLSLGWWGRQEVASARIEPDVQGAAAGGLAARKPIRLGVLDYVNAQLAVDPRQVPYTPFRPSNQMRVLRNVDSGTGGSAGVVTIGDGVAVDPVAPDDGPTPEALADATAGVNLLRRFKFQRRRPPSNQLPIEEAGPEPTELVYHGIMKRPDGVVLAVVAEADRTRFLRVGDAVSGLRVERVGSDRLRVRQQNGEILELVLSEPVAVLEGVRRAE